MAREGSTRLKSQERGRQLAYHDAVVRLLYTYRRFLVKRTKEAATNVGPIALPTIRSFYRFSSPFLLSSFPLIDQIKNVRCLLSIIFLIKITRSQVTNHFLFSIISPRDI